MDFSPDTCSVDVPNKTSNNNLDPYTALFWAYPFGFTAGDRLASKHSSVNRILRFGNSSSSAANFNIERQRVTENLKYETSGTPAVVDKWQFFASRLDTAAAGNKAGLFLGDLGKPAVEQSYGTSTDGSGAISNDASSVLWVGSQVSAGSATFNGMIAFFAYFEQAMTLSQIREQQFNPHVTGMARIFMLPGSNGLGLVEDLGPFRNHGTLAGGPILGDGAAVFSMFRRRRRVFSSPIGGAALLRVVDETEQIIEVVEDHRALKTVVDETEQLSEAATRARSLTRVTDEIERVAESVEAHRATTQVVNETEDVAEGVVSAKGFLRVVDETEQLTEVAEAHRATTRVIDETEQLMDASARAQTMTRVVDETENANENTTRARAMMRVVDEVERVVEGALPLRGLRRVVGSVVRLVEAFASKLAAAVVSVPDDFVADVNVTLAVSSVVNVSLVSRYDANATLAVSVSVER